MEENLHAKTCSILSVVSIQYRLVTDGRTDTRRQQTVPRYHSEYRFFLPRDAKLARVLDPVYVCLTPCQFSIEKVKRIGLGFSTYPTLCYKEI